MSPERSGQLALALYAAAAVVAVVAQTLRRPGGKMVWWLYVAERLACGLLWHVRGYGPDGRPRRCPFPQTSAALIVANHLGAPSDPVVLWQNHHLSGPERRVRPISFLMAREFYDNPRMTWFYKALRSIPVNRDGRDMGPVKQAIAHLKAGDLVGIFAEGGINKTAWGVKAANPGVAFLALATDAPVYPVFISVVPLGKNMMSSFLRTARTRLTYGDPLDLSPWKGQKKSHELLCEVTDHIMNALAALGGVSYEGTCRVEESDRDDRPAPAAEAAVGPAPS